MLPVFNANCPNAPPCRKLRSRKRGGGGGGSDACRAIPDPLSEDGTSAYNVISVGHPNRDAPCHISCTSFFEMYGYTQTLFGHMAGSAAIAVLFAAIFYYLKKWLRLLVKRRTIQEKHEQQEI